MAGVNFRTASKFASIVGNSASTSGGPSNATLLFTCPESHEAEIVFLMVANEATSTAVAVAEDEVSLADKVKETLINQSKDEVDSSEKKIVVTTKKLTNINQF